MPNFSEQIVDDSGYQRPVGGAMVYLLNMDGTLAPATTANPVKTDDFGLFSFTIADGLYKFEARIGGVAIAKGNAVVGNPPQFTGPSGPANSSFADKPTLKAAPVNNLSYILANSPPSVYAYVPGNFAYADDTNVLKLNSTALTTGALVGGQMPLQIVTRAVLSALIPPSAGMVIDLLEAGREGRFIWKTGDYSARVAIDTAQGIYVPSNLVAATSGCWVRVALGPMFTSWFGVVHDAGEGSTVSSTATNNGPAIRAAFAAASSFQRPLLLSKGGVMWDYATHGAFFVFDGDPQTRGSPIWQMTGYKDNPLIAGQSGPLPNCRFSNLYINGNAVAGADVFVYEATGSSGGSGGLWYSSFNNVQINRCGGRAMAFWTGATSGDYVHQFLSLHDVIVYRTADNATARCLSVAGRFAQVYITGHSEFDGNGVPGVKREGVNVVLGRRWAEGDFYSHLNAGNTGNPLSSGPAVVTMSATVQGLRNGIIIDNASALSLHDMWFESIERSIAVYNGSQVKIYNPRFANAASDRISDGNNLGVGYGIAKDASSVVTVEGYEFYGLVDSATGGGGTFRTMDGSDAGNWLISPSGVVPGWKGYTKGVTNTVATTGGVLRLLGVKSDVALLPAGTDDSPATVTAVELDLQPSRGLRLLATGPFRYSYNGNNNVDVGGKSFRLRSGDIFDILASDSGTSFTGTVTRRRLSFSSAPAANQLDDNEFAWNDNVTITSGKVLLGWVKVPGTGITPFYGTNA